MQRLSRNTITNYRLLDTEEKWEKTVSFWVKFLTDFHLIFYRLICVIAQGLFRFTFVTKPQCKWLANSLVVSLNEKKPYSRLTYTHFDFNLIISYHRNIGWLTDSSVFFYIRAFGCNFYLNLLNSTYFFAIVVMSQRLPQVSPRAINLTALNIRTLFIYLMRQWRSKSSFEKYSATSITLTIINLSDAIDSDQTTTKQWKNEFY